MKKFLIFSLIIFLCTLLGTYRVQKIGADSGWDSSYDSGGSDWGSSSSDWGSSSSDWSSSSSSWDSSSSSSYGSSTGSFNNMPIYWAIFMELFCSIHYFVFAFKPLGSIFGKDEKQAMKIALILFAIRACLLVILDTINPSFSIFDFIFLFILAFIIVPVSAIFGKKNSNNKSYIPSYNYQEVSDSILQQYGINNKDELKQKLFEQFIDIQNAWMNFDYHTLNLLLTDELYNMYVSQLEALKVKNEKNIMSDYQFIEAKIYSVTNDNGILTVKLYLNVKMYDYVVDYYNKVVRGNKNKKIDIKYHITFQKNIDTIVDICPNCAAKIENNQTNCIYCGCKIVNATSNFVMSKKECIGQK